MAGRGRRVSGGRVVDSGVMSRRIRRQSRQDSRHRPSSPGVGPAPFCRLRRQRFQNGTAHRQPPPAAGTWTPRQEFACNPRALTGRGVARGEAPLPNHLVCSASRYLAAHRLVTYRSAAPCRRTTPPTALFAATVVSITNSWLPTRSARFISSHCDANRNHTATPMQLHVVQQSAV